MIRKKVYPWETMQAGMRGCWVLVHRQCTRRHVEQEGESVLWQHRNVTKKEELHERKVLAQRMLKTIMYEEQLLSEPKVEVPAEENTQTPPKYLLACDTATLWKEIGGEEAGTVQNGSLLFYEDCAEDANGETWVLVRVYGNDEKGWIKESKTKVLSDEEASVLIQKLAMSQLEDAETSAEPTEEPEVEVTVEPTTESTAEPTV